jgi:hypothetical protein
MKRLGIAFALALVLFITSAAPPARQLLPIVQAQTLPATAQIYACQCGAVQATTMRDGRVLLTILDHSRGGAVVVGIDDGRTFQELALPPTRIGVPSPAFDYPGTKQGPGASVEAFGGIVTYAPNRTEPDGRYNIWRYAYQVP